METTQYVVDTLFKTRNIVVTRESTEIISYVDVSTLIKSAVLFAMSLFLVTLLSGIVKYVRKLGDSKNKNHKSLLKGLHLALLAAWVTDLYMLVSLPTYETTYILIGLCLTILIYDIIVIITELGKVGFSVGTVLQLGSAVLKSMFNKNPEHLAHFLDELSEEEKKKETHKVRKGGGVAMLLLILIGFTIPASLNAPERVSPNCVKHTVMKRHTKVLKLTKKDKVIYSIRINHDKVIKENIADGELRQILP